MAAAAKTVLPSVSDLKEPPKAPKKPEEDPSITDLVESLKKTNLDGDLPSIFVDSADDVTELVDALVGLPKSPPSLYIDIEGINLSRNGTMSILQIFVSPKKMTYLVDIHTLGKTAFSTAGTDKKKTLKTILEASEIPKVFFDVRNDSDALFTHFGIKLQGIQDVQLMELATRNGFSKRFVHGLAKCIAEDGSLTYKERRKWTQIKDKGRELFAPELGGSFQVFNTRPLAEDIRSYCVQDVQFLPRLRGHYWAMINSHWKAKVEAATRARVAESQTANYRPDGRQKALGPW